MPKSKLGLSGFGSWESGVGSSRGRRFYMNDDVFELRESSDELVFHHVRCGMCLLQRCVTVEPDMQVHERVVS
jgi:hypothetical protein